MALEYLYQVISDNRVDVVRGNVKGCVEEEYFNWRDYAEENKVELSYRTRLELIQDTDGFKVFSEVWLAIYKREYLFEKNIFFRKENYFNEDVVFNYLLALSAPKMIISTRTVYFHNHRADSDGNLRTLDHRLRRDANMIELIFFYKLIYDKCYEDPDFPQKILTIIKRDYQYYTFVYWGLMIKIRGLRRSDIGQRIVRFKNAGIYPFPHFFPKNLPSGYPNSILFKILWTLISFIPTLKILLYLRCRR